MKMQINIGRITAAVFRAGQSILSERFKGLDISSGQMDFLYVITMKEGLSQLELAELLYVGKSAVTKVINALEKKGYVRRETDPSDLRVSRLYLTDKGRDIAENIQETFQEMRFLHGKYLSEEEAAQTMQSLEKVLSGLLMEKEKLHQNNG